MNIFIEQIINFILQCNNKKLSLLLH